jgi:hypothetical protein
LTLLVTRQCVPDPCEVQNFGVKSRGAAGDGAGCGRSGRTHTIPSLKPAEPIPNASERRLPAHRTWTNVGH